jgi:cytochrome c biogenesis protein CcmG, thiol:disulfide interchange protein DsbE
MRSRLRADFRTPSGGAAGNGSALGSALLGARTVIALLLLLRPVAGTSADNLLDLAAYRGRVVYLDFWASWCVPCHESFPWMNNMQAQFGADGLSVIAVDVDHERAAAEQFLRTHPAQFRIVYDPQGLLAEKFGVRGMPSSFLIDRTGHIQSRHEGFRLADRAALAQQIRSLVKAR